MRGMTTILSPQIPYYINRRQSKLETEPKSQGYGDETVERVYNYKPMNGISEELQPKYLGVQANFWTEWVVEPSVVQYLMLPRLAAVAELCGELVFRRHPHSGCVHTVSDFLLDRIHQKAVLCCFFLCFRHTRSPLNFILSGQVSHLSVQIHYKKPYNFLQERKSLS